MSRLPWLVVVAVLVAIVFVAQGSPAVRVSTRSAANTPFAITRVDIPLFIKQNGAKGARKIYWSGNPVFPVTVNEHGICPESVNCGARDAFGWGTPIGKSVFTNRANPLVTPSEYFCSGSLTTNYVIGTEYWLTDAKGHKTAKVRDFFVCKTH